MSQSDNGHCGLDRNRQSDSLLIMNSALKCALLYLDQAEQLNNPYNPCSGGGLSLCTSAAQPINQASPPKIFALLALFDPHFNPSWIP